MSNTNQHLTKNCISCGQQKPLTAFLELTSDKGTQYGNVCSSCRRAHLEKERANKELEESGTKSDAGGARMRAEERLVIERQKQEQHDQIEEEYKEERKELREEEQAARHKSDELQHTENATRESIRKQTLFTRPITQHADRAVQTKERYIEERKKHINTDAPMLDTQFAGQIKAHNPMIREIASRMFGGSALGKQFGVNKQSEKKGEKAAEFIQEKWGPGKKR